MPESEIREMLAIASGRSKGDVVWVEDVRDLPPIRPTGLAGWIASLRASAASIGSGFRAMIAAGRSAGPVPPAGRPSRARAEHPPTAGSMTDV